jgi:hypothetical protein
MLVSTKSEAVMSSVSRGPILLGSCSLLRLDRMAFEGKPICRIR